MADPVSNPGTATFDDLVLVKRSETEVYRGQERLPLLSLRSPAYGFFSSRGTERMVQVCAARGLGTNRPNRLEIHYSNTARAIIGVPMIVTDAADDEDLFEITWNESQGRAAINLLELLQPRNMTVPRDQIMELPISVREVSNLGHCLVIDMSEPVYRSVREQATAAAAAQQ